MNLFKQWKEIAGQERSQGEYEKFWADYFEAEKKNYEQILESKSNTISGKLSEVAKKFNMDSTTFTGFLDGINSSLINSLELDKLDEDTNLSIEIDFEKLYLNMLDAKADWLYNLPQWDEILGEERCKEITKEFKASKIAVSNKVGRNDLCPCGSGKKYKKCCGA